MVAHETISKEVSKLHFVIVTLSWFDLSHVLCSPNTGILIDSGKGGNEFPTSEALLGEFFRPELSFMHPNFSRFKKIDQSLDSVLNL